jgi:hypothetical protein
LLFNDAPSPPCKIAHALQPMAPWQVYLTTSRWPLLDKVPGGPHPQVVDPTPFFVSLSAIPLRHFVSFHVDCLVYSVLAFVGALIRMLTRVGELLKLQS